MAENENSESGNDAPRMCSPTQYNATTDFDGIINSDNAGFVSDKETSDHHHNQKYDAPRSDENNVPPRSPHDIIEPEKPYLDKSWFEIYPDELKRLLAFRKNPEAQNRAIVF